MTNITNEQLEAWASLGPWEWGETGSRFQPETALVHKDAGIVLNASWRPSSCEVTVSDPDSEALIAAAPALAAALLAERTARAVEVGDLKRTMFTVRVIAVDALFQPTFQRTALERISAELRAALEGPTP